MERNRASRSSVMCDKHGSKCISFRWWPCWFRAFSLCVCVWVGGFLQLCGCLLRHNEERQHHETRTKSCQHLHKTQNEKEKKKVGMKEKGTWERTLRKKKRKESGLLCGALGCVGGSLCGVRGSWWLFSQPCRSFRFNGNFLSSALWPFAVALWVACVLCSRRVAEE